MNYKCKEGDIVRFKNLVDYSYETNLKVVRMYRDTFYFRECCVLEKANSLKFSSPIFLKKPYQIQIFAKYLQLQISTSPKYFDEL